jgi:hypothetical protein
MGSGKTSSAGVARGVFGRSAESSLRRDKPDGGVIVPSDLPLFGFDRRDSASASLHYNHPCQASTGEGWLPLVECSGRMWNSAAQTGGGGCKIDVFIYFKPTAPRGSE